VLECVGHEQAVVTALEIARPGGAVGRVGVPQNDATPTGIPFWKNVSVAGGPAPARAYIDEFAAARRRGRLRLFIPVSELSRWLEQTPPIRSVTGARLARPPANERVYGLRRPVADSASAAQERPDAWLRSPRDKRDEFHASRAREARV
jgi:hypothetical protein